MARPLLLVLLLASACSPPATPPVSQDPDASIPDVTTDLPQDQMPDVPPSDMPEDLPPDLPPDLSDDMPRDLQEDTPADMPEPGPIQVAVEVERVDAPPMTLSPFRVRVTATNALGPVSAMPPTITAERGTLGAITEAEPGVYIAQITPDATGEHGFVVELGDERIERRAIVFAQVDGALGQPMSVEGLVNTPGYEDGVTITPDGRYLFVQTGPVHFSGLFYFQSPVGCDGNRLTPTPCMHPWIDQTIGAYQAPERPGFFRGRIAQDGTLRHNSALYQVGDNVAPNFAPMTMFYGFERQADGSFAQPFWVAFEDEQDAIINPFGLSFVMTGPDRATMLVAHRDIDTTDPPIVRDVDLDGDNMATEQAPSGWDIYTREITFGQNTVLGSYIPGAQPLEITRMSLNVQRVGFDPNGPDGHFGSQGNPHLHEREGRIHSIWTDDEFDSAPNGPSHEDYEDLTVYINEGTFPQGPWTRVTLPATINTAGQEIQPFFTGEGLVYTQDVNIVYSAYTGPHTAQGYADAANWSDPVVLLRKDDDASGIIAVGEPTVAVLEGRTLIYFVYGHVRGRDPMTNLPDIDMQAGWVELRPGAM